MTTVLTNKSAAWDRHLPGQPQLSLKPGDFILEHGVHLAPRIIRFGQRLRFRGEDAPFAYWSHAALAIGDGKLIEAKGQHPVRVVPLSYYDDKNYVAVYTTGDDQMRANAVKFAQAQCGRGYGYISLFFLSLWTIFGGVRLSVGNRRFFCSDLVAEATERLGYIYSDNPLTIMPADLAKAFDVR